MTVLGFERRVGEGVVATRPRAGEQLWVRRLGWFAGVCAFAAAIFGFLGLVDIIKGADAWPAAVALVVFAGLAGAAAGLKWRAIIVLAFAVGIAYAVWSNRLEDAARRTARSPASKAEVSGQDDGAKPIHPE